MNLSAYTGRHHTGNDLTCEFSVFPSQGTVKSHLHFSECIIIENIPDGNQINGVGLFLKDKPRSTLLPGVLSVTFITVLIVIKDMLSSYLQGEKGLLGHPGKRGKRGFPGSQGDQGQAGEAGLKGPAVSNHSC